MKKRIKTKLNSIKNLGGSKKNVNKPSKEGKEIILNDDTPLNSNLNLTGDMSANTKKNGDLTQVAGLGSPSPDRKSGKFNELKV